MPKRHADGEEGTSGSGEKDGVENGGRGIFDSLLPNSNKKGQAKEQANGSGSRRTSLDWTPFCPKRKEVCKKLPLVNHV